MIWSWKWVASVALATWLAAPASGNQAAILQIRVTQGEGAVHRIGSRAISPLIVQITDETGRPVEGVAVSFRMPDEGPSGVFANGLRTELVLTGPDGRAVVRDMRWNQTPGRFEIRITAVKGEARAGTLVPQYLSDAQAAAKQRSRKWLWVAAAGGAAAGILAAVSSGSTSGGAPAPGPPQIGTPTITIGAP